MQATSPYTMADPLGQVWTIYPPGTQPRFPQLMTWTVQIWFSADEAVGKDFDTQELAETWVKNNAVTVNPPTPSRTSPSLAARIPMMPILALRLFKKCRDSLINEDVHKKIHPVV